MEHRSAEQLEAGLATIRESPNDHGALELIVRRPQIDAREMLEVAELNLEEGLAGDTWNQRPSRRTENGGPHPEMQLNVMNSRAIALLAGSQQRWALAGDQLYVDLDLSDANLPAGTQLAIGSAVIEVTAQPHTGCSKFADRFGAEAVRFVNIGAGKELRLRGINARVVQPGTIRRGDTVSKLG